MDCIENEESMLLRHKRESKELTGRITGMKKQANKNTRKTILKEIKELEESLKRKHEEELKAFKAGAGQVLENQGVPEGKEEDSDEELTPEKLLAQLELASKEDPPKPAQTSAISNGGKTKKKNRQKERLAKREAEIKRIQDEARKEQDKQPDLRGIELRNLQELCDMQSVKQVEIIPDGHCLFSSIADQLKVRHGIKATVQQLRKEAGDYIIANSDDFIPFLFDEETMTMKNIDDYVDQIVNTAMWGGDLEILALSKVYDCPISVMMSGRAPLRMNEQGSNPELKLVYYQHAFGLGEHYNSLHDL